MGSVVEPQDEILFIYSIDGGPEAHTLINRLGIVILMFHVETNPADLGIRLGSGRYVLMHRSIHPTVAPCRCDIDALDPPKEPVSPITPFKCDHKLAHGGSRRLKGCVCKNVKAILWLCQECERALSEAIEIQASVLGFKCHGRIEIDDSRHILCRGWSDVEQYLIHDHGMMAGGVVSHPARGR